MKKKFFAYVLGAALMCSGLATATLGVGAAGDVSGGDVSGGDVSGGDAVVDSFQAAADGTAITGDSTMNLPVIKVTVPTNIDIVLNPFQLTYEHEGNERTDQVITAVQSIKNESNVAVAVNIEELQATPSEGVKVATASAKSSTDKSIYLYLAIGADDAALNAALEKFNSKTCIAVPVVEGKVKAASKENAITLAAGDTTPTEAKFAIGGDMVANPTVNNADKTVTPTPWVDADTVSVSFKFTFTPQIVTPAN